MEKWKKAFGVPEKERIQLGKEIWKIAAEEVYIIGVVGLGAARQGVRIVKNNMGNIPARMYNSPDGKTPGISRPATFYWKQLTERRRDGGRASVLAYIGRRALLAIFTVWAISVLSFAIIQLPPGDYVTSYIAQMASTGSVVTRGRGGESPHPVRPRPADLRAVPEVDEPHRARQLRHVDGVAPAGHAR